MICLIFLSVTAHFCSLFLSLIPASLLLLIALWRIFPGASDHDGWINLIKDQLGDGSRVGLTGRSAPVNNYITLELSAG